MDVNEIANCPAGLKYVSLDTAAECSPVSEETYAELWRLVRTLDEKRVEREWPEPDADEAASLGKWWPSLSEDVRQDILKAAKEEGWMDA